MKIYKKYQYLGYTYPGVSKHWVPIVEEMFKRIDKQVRPWYIPRFILNIIHYWATGNSVVRVRSWFWYDLLHKIVPITIMDIKDKYAELRVYGSFTKEVEAITDWAVSECEKICEKCGSRADVQYCASNGGRGWVYNYCIDCRVEAGLENEVLTNEIIEE